MNYICISTLFILLRYKMKKIYYIIPIENVSNYLRNMNEIKGGIAHLSSTHRKDSAVKTLWYKAFCNSTMRFIFFFWRVGEHKPIYLWIFEQPAFHLAHHHSVPSIQTACVRGPHTNCKGGCPRTGRATQENNKQIGKKNGDLCGVRRRKLRPLWMYLYSPRSTSTGACD